MADGMTMFDVVLVYALHLLAAVALTAAVVIAARLCIAVARGTCWLLDEGGEFLRRSRRVLSGKPYLVRVPFLGRNCFVRETLLGWRACDASGDRKSVV